MNDVTGFLSSVLVTLITLLPIINPVSTAILLLGISEHLTKKELNRQIIMACIYMTGILVVFLLAGHFIMIFFGISIPGIRIAGGMVIGFLGFKMLIPNEASITQAEKNEAIKKIISRLVPWQCRAWLDQALSQLLLQYHHRLMENMDMIRFLILPV